jgi:hypothetical protein
MAQANNMRPEKKKKKKNHLIIDEAEGHFFTQRSALPALTKY